MDTVTAYLSWHYQCLYQHSYGFCNNLKTSESTLTASTTSLTCTIARSQPSSTLSQPVIVILWTLKHSHGHFKSYSILAAVISHLTVSTIILIPLRAHSRPLTAISEPPKALLWPTILNMRNCDAYGTQKSLHRFKINGF